MSGIAGIYNLDQRPVDLRALTGMLDCIPNRGSDGVRIWSDVFVGLGHRQLCTTKESAREVQPANSRDGTCWITFDGRIDNREELIDRFQTTPGTVANCTDVELALHAYESWNIECVKHLIGDFAFALWDGAEQQLFCVRDPYGIRPFYYHFNRQKFMFGSECLQLFQDDQIPIEVNQEKVAEWFTQCGLQSYTYRDNTRTFFQGIRQLPFAHYLLVNRSGLTLKRYWDINPKRRIFYRREEEYSEHFYDLFREAVRCRLRAPGPVGAELSGGYDSSSIVCAAAEISRSEGLKLGLPVVFSLVFDELSCDERPLIKTVIEKYGLEFHFLASDELCGLRQFPPARDSLRDISFPDQMHTQEAMEALYARAHERGIRVMLSGEGAENHVLGTRLVFDSLIRKLKVRELFSRIRFIAAERSGRSIIADLVKYGFIPLLPASFSARWFDQWLRSGVSRPNFPDFFTPSFRAKLHGEIARQREELRVFPQFREWGRQVEYEALNPSHPVFHMSFDPPVERRFPYHDRRLVEFCLAIPPEQKYHDLSHARSRNFRGRTLQRRSLAALLPEPILNSWQKVNFNDVYLRRFIEFRDAYGELFAPPRLPRVGKLGYVDAGKFWSLLSNCFADIDRYSQIDDYACLWINRITVLEIWLLTLESMRMSSGFTEGEVSDSTPALRVPAN